MTGAAQRRKQRRLRLWWRHEQQSVAAALATFQHHSSRGQKTARAGEEESETKYTATLRKMFRTTPPPHPFSSACTTKSPAGGGRPVWSSRRDRKSGSSGTPWSSLPSSLPWCRFSMYLCRRWWTNWWTCSSSSTTRCPSRLSTSPRSHRTPSRSVRSSSSRSWRNSWWKCRPRQGTHLRWLPCKPLGGGQQGLYLSSSTPPGQGGIQILATATVADVAVADVSVNMQYKFQQFRFSFFQFINRVVVIPVATQRQVRTALSVQRTVVIPRVQCLDLGVVPQVQLCGVADVSVIMQRQVSGFPGRWSMYLLCRSSFGASRATVYGGSHGSDSVGQIVASCHRSWKKS